MWSNSKAFSAFKVAEGFFFETATLIHIEQKAQIKQKEDKQKK
jgi:hypothetical protein